MNEQLEVRDAAFVPQTPEKQGLINTFYLFYPVLVNADDAPQEYFIRKVNELERSGSADLSGAGSVIWKQSAEAEKEVRYMFRYISEKLNSDDKNNCHCVHYTLAPEFRESVGLSADSSAWYRFKNSSLNTELAFEGALQISEIHLYYFNTQTAIMAFELHAKTCDPMNIAEMQFHLKNARRAKVFADEGAGEQTVGTGDGREIHFWSVIETLSRSTFGENAQIFFYVHPDSARCNFFSYVETTAESEETCRRNLYYLRHCYNKTYIYSDELDAAHERYASVKDITWGITGEAAVCLSNVTADNELFLRNILARNFKNEYLFMYVLLLHQKYMLYRFKTKMGTNVYRKLSTLKDYYEKLCEFETDFMLNRITEVPQYQELYERIQDVFSLREMLDNVREPISYLSEMRQREAEKKRQGREWFLNIVLAVFSLFAAGTAWVDGITLLNFLGSHFGVAEEIVAKWVAAWSLFVPIVFAALLLMVIWAIVQSVVSKKE